MKALKSIGILFMVCLLASPTTSFAARPDPTPDGTGTLTGKVMIAGSRTGIDEATVTAVGADETLLRRIIDEETLRIGSPTVAESYSELYEIPGPLDLTSLMELASIPNRDYLRDPPFSPQPPRGARWRRNRARACSGPDRAARAPAVPASGQGPRRATAFPRGAVPRESPSRRGNFSRLALESIKTACPLERDRKPIPAKPRASGKAAV